MGNSCFGTRPRLSFTKKELNELKLDIDLKNSELNDWYLRFLNCYPYGYLNFEEFFEYFQNFNEENYSNLKDLIKDLFHLFDLNKDEKLNFNEFILFNQLINNGTIEEKFHRLLQLYDHQKEKSLNKSQLNELIRNLFYLFNIPYSKSNTNDIIQWIFHINHLEPDQTILWEQFQSETRNNDLVYRELLCLPNQTSTNLIQLTERF